MIEARLLTGIPMAEESALLRAPVRWDLGTGERRIRMATPLFSLHRYVTWNRAVAAVRLQLAQGPQLSLGDWLRVMENEPAAGTLMMEDALVALHQETGVWPQSLADPLIAVSDPVDAGEAWDVLLAWSAGNGMAWSAPAEQRVDALRHYLMLYCSHVLDVSSLCLILSQMQQVMVEIKKKLLVDSPATTVAEASPWQRERRRLQQRRASRSTSSPGSGRS